MTVDELFVAWWMVFGQDFWGKLGFPPTNKEVARYAFEAGFQAGKTSARSTDEDEEEKA